MSTPRLRPRTYLLDAELARSTVVELPNEDAGPARSFGDLLRSLLPATVGEEVAEGPVTLVAREVRVAD